MYVFTFLLHRFCAQTGSKPDLNTKLKFTAFFKNIVVELDREAYGPDHHLSEWQRDTKTDDASGFLVRFVLSILQLLLIFYIHRII